MSQAETEDGLLCEVWGKNSDETETCTKCGAKLYLVGERLHYRSVEKGCFGIPKGNNIVSLFFGIVVILAGVSWLVGYEWTMVWPAIVMLFGILLIIAALYGMRRRH